MSGKRRYFLDTNALIALGEGDQGLATLLACADHVATSIICKIEYLTGIAEDETSRELFEEMLRAIEVVDLRNSDVSLVSGIVSIRAKRKGIRLPDTIVMASAKATRSVLLTRDRQLLNAGLCDAKKF